MSEEDQGDFLLLYPYEGETFEQDWSKDKWMLLPNRTGTRTSGAPAQPGAHRLNKIGTRINGAPAPHGVRRLNRTGAPAHSGAHRPSRSGV